MQPKCPELRSKPYYELGFCNLSDHYCELETGVSCPTYDEYLEELFKEWLAKNIAPDA